MKMKDIFEYITIAIFGGIAVIIWLAIFSAVYVALTDDNEEK